MLLSKHFDRAEFKCPDCDFDTVDTKLLEVLEAVRKHFGKPVTITSGCRCAEHNAAVGGAASSQHLRGRAADFIVQDWEPASVQDYLKIWFPDSLGIGSSAKFTHVDTRTNGPARWSY